MKTILAFLMLCSTSFGQLARVDVPHQAAVRLDLFPAAEPVRLDLFPTTEPVRLDLFPEVKPAPKRDPVKELVPAPMHGSVNVPTVVGYVTANCDHCRRAEREYGDAKRRGVALPFVMVFRDTSPSWVRTWPTIHYPSRQSATGWGKTEGWPGLDEFVRIFQSANQLQQARELMSTRDLIRSMPRNYSTWTHPADLTRHIREHGFTGSLDGLSYHELELLHDGLHEGLIPLNPPHSPPRRFPPAHNTIPMYESRRRSIRPKRMDPLTILSIIGFAWNVGTFLFKNCPCN